MRLLLFVAETTKQRVVSLASVYLTKIFFVVEAYHFPSLAGVVIATAFMMLSIRGRRKVASGSLESDFGNGSWPDP